MLYLVATPIGNLADITLRALDLLKSCDLILCEDTRHSKRLLSHYQISKPLRSYHQFNERESLERLIEELQSGKTIALISDAGSPAIADPGYLIVKRCREEKIPVFSLPGPSALIAALTISGLPSERFQFMGFLSKKESHLKELFIEMLHYPGTSICYETPHHIKKSLQLFAKIKPNKEIVILRELTKLHEEYLKGTTEELLCHFTQTPPLGEMVLLIEGEEPPLPSFSPEELQQAYGLPLKEAIKLCAQLQGVPKRTIYNKTLQVKKEC